MRGRSIHDLLSRSDGLLIPQLPAVDPVLITLHFWVVREDLEAATQRNSVNITEHITEKVLRFLWALANTCNGANIV